MAWPLAILATWGVSKAIYPAVIHRDAEAAVHIKCHAAAMHPQWACLAFRAVVVNPAVDNQTKRKIAAVQVRKVGWTMNNIPPQISYSDTTLPDEQLADLLRYIDKLPFERIGYRGLDLFLTQHPEFKPRVPPAIMTRLPYLRGDVGLIEPDLNAIPATMDEAIDCFSHIIWALERDVPIQRIATALQGLCRRYVDIPGVSLIAVEAGLESPDIFDFLIPFKENMKDCFIPRTVEILEEIKSPGQARKAMPLVRMLWSPVIDNMDAGRTTSNYMNPQSLDIYYALVRVWMLTRIKDDMYKATMPKTQPTAITPPASGETSRTLQAPIPAGTPEANNR